MEYGIKEREKILNEVNALLHTLPHFSDCNIVDGLPCSCGLDSMKSGWADYQYNLTK